MNLDLAKLNKFNLSLALAIGSLVFIIDIFLLKSVINAAYPIGDEFALIVESQKSFMNWFKEGYANYFNVYPEYYSPYTNFIRPVANLLFRLFSYTPDPVAYQLIGVNYFVHAALCSLLYLVSITFNNTLRFSITLGILTFLAPAFWLTPMTEVPSFSLDGLAALLCILSLIALVKNYFFLGLLTLTLSVFTKETAIPISIAWMLIGINRKNYKVFTCGITALLLWVGIRMLAFNSLTEGTYSFNELSFKSLAFRATSFLTLPLGNFSIENVKQLFLDKKLSFELLYLVINFTVWVFSLQLLIRSLNNFKRSNDYLVFLIAFVGSLSYYFVIGGSVRFSYLSYLLWLIVICGANDLKIKTIIVSLLLFSSSLSFFLKTHEVSEINNFYYKQSKSFINYLEENSFGGNIYIINDFIGRYSRQDAIGSYSESNSQLFRGSSISFGSCHISELKQIKTKLTFDKNNNKIINTDLPRCAAFVFEGASTKKIIENIYGSYLYRNSDINYKFNDIQIKKTVFGKNPFVVFGNQMEVLISSKFHVLYFDFQDNKWVFVH
jgi:hypothetical protein